MSVSGDYAQPVPVNGYLCWNCSQVADAKQGVNPADIKPGETAAQAKASSSSSSSSNSNSNTTPTSAVTFGGSLVGTAASGTNGPTATATAAPSTGAWLNVTA